MVSEIPRPETSGKGGDAQPAGGEAVGGDRMRSAEGLGSAPEQPDPHDPQFDGQPVFAKGPDGNHVWWGTPPGADTGGDGAAAPTDSPDPVFTGPPASIERLTASQDDVGDGFGQPIEFTDSSGDTPR